MSYLIELQTRAGMASYMIANGENPSEALAQVHERLGMDDEEEEVVVVAVHTVH